MKTVKAKMRKLITADLIRIVQDRKDGHPSAAEELVRRKVLPPYSYKK